MSKFPVDVPALEFPVNEEESVKPADCRIEDVYVLSHQDAKIKRRIVYFNLSSSLYPVDLSQIQIKYFRGCRDFEVKVNGESVAFTQPVHDFEKFLICEGTYKLALNERLEIEIECTWPNFANLQENFPFIISYPEEIKYSLRIDKIYLENTKSLILKNGQIAEKLKDYFFDGGSIIFTDCGVHSGKTHTIEVRILSTPNTLDTLAYHVRGISESKPFNNCILVIIQHLLGDFVHLAEAFYESGVSKDNMFIIGIPYSTKDQTVDYLRLNGYSNIETPKEYPFDNIVREILIKAMKLASNTSKPILIVEDGGYAVPLVHEEYRAKESLFVGAVEQTANGIWRDKDLSEKKKLDYLFPIINVADSRIKEQLESPLIGQAVCRNLERLLGKEFTDVAGKVVGLVGFGRTGSQIATGLKSKGAAVKVFSTDAVDLARAKSEGYTVTSSYIDLVKGSKIVIEATGHQWAEEWAGRAIIMSFENDSWFVSASSKRMGIDYAELGRIADPKKIIRIPGIGIQYEISGKRIMLVADGYPINFFNSESVPDKKIEFIPTLLFESARFLIENRGKLDKGIIEHQKNKDLNKIFEAIAKVYLDFIR